MSRFSLQGRTALVTGGARGCGLAFARGLAEAGANVAIFDRIPPEEGFLSIEKEYDRCRVDVSSPESLATGFGAFQTDFNNKLDICVPCAGINRHQTFLEFNYADHQELLGVNVLGLFHTAQLAARQMIANGTKHGSIVLVASMASHVAVRSQLCSAYCGSKGAVRAMCPAIAKELAEYGIRVNSISPGYVRTEMTAAFPHLIEEWKSAAMNGRIAEPEDIMGACVFLASDASSYMTGQDVIVDGGVTKCGVISSVGDRSEPHHRLATNYNNTHPEAKNNLIRYGTPVTLLDDRPTATSTGKADGLQPKTIETLKQLRLSDELLRNGAKVYDICFWESTTHSPTLTRTSRQTHYPDHLVGASDPYILLAHQGMLENVLIKDIEERGGYVQRNSPFVSVSKTQDGSGELEVIYDDNTTNTKKFIRTKYLVGCDGARSKVRDFIPGAQLEGEMSNASWGVLDGVIDTDFPDLWSKVAVRSHTAGSILWIPRERGMTRLYVELSSTDGERVDRAKATPEYVMARAREAMQPFRLEWKEIEWFGNYVVGQRVARRFSDPENQIFIAGDAGHVHSALAAQGANTSMHDSVNLAWKLNLVARNLAPASLLNTYSEERRKIANDLIAFDAGHVAAFEKGEAALARNFEENIRFISGVGAEYDTGVLTKSAGGKVKGGIQAGTLTRPAKLTRYIDANLVDLQLDIPMMGQFRVVLFVGNVVDGKGFLKGFCGGVGLDRVDSVARESYKKCPRGVSDGDKYFSLERYTLVSEVVTYGLVTRSQKREFELGDLPELLQKSRWTVYLDDVEGGEGCTGKWMGEMERDQVGVMVVRPDGYVGAKGVWGWSEEEGSGAAQWVGEYLALGK
ncbi:FAD binding domain protein [Aspergillus piperis CBS 112811]|uniref:FAD binding domain protein n=1 Tax=Aspergillus piperis CBS 112811 TaxID=1448313 RepID=A0A8G1VJG6_9EURO|nr:FAD binding domain protein [Aspergillus piperis CBS 112811]RAH54680.1 FAD binding domain protein [Aspergillus piperis CBS 112811]